MAGAFTGFGELTLVTRDGSGPNGQEGGFYPFISSFSLTRTADVVVTWGGYNSTAGGPVQLEVTNVTATATTVDLDNASNTLTFHSNYEGLEIYYTIRKSASKSVIGLGSPTIYGSLEFFGQVSTSGTSTAAGYGIYIPELTLDGSVSLSVTGDDEIEVPFSPVINGTNSEAVLLIEL